MTKQTSVHFSGSISEPKRPRMATVLTVAFRLNGQQFTALNGGPKYKFTEAVSFVLVKRRRKWTITGTGYPMAPSKSNAAGGKTNSDYPGKSWNTTRVR